jgi:cysteinyl-tRNA synthetase
LGKGETLKMTFKRLRKTLQFDKTSFRNDLEQLRRWNEDLERINKRISRNNKYHQTQRKAMELYRKLPAAFEEIRKTASGAHDALTSSFTCRDALHVNHSAALALQEQLDRPAQLALALCYTSKRQRYGQLLPSEDVIADLCKETCALKRLSISFYTRVI